MIPKVIHYCWFGRNPLPPLAEKCIASWKRFFPDYEVKEWNEDNFDVNSIPYTQEAYRVKKYAFVSDYARFWILYHYGGLYFDTDVEVIKPMDDIVARGAFMGCENDARKSKQSLLDASAIGVGCNPGLGLGCAPGEALLQELLELYVSMHFLGENGEMNQTTIVEYTTRLLVKKGLRWTSEIQQVADFYIYPKEYFCPLGMDGVMELTENSRSIHHYMASWGTKSKKKFYWSRCKEWMKKWFPSTITSYILRTKKKKRDERNKKLFN